MDLIFEQIHIKDIEAVLKLFKEAAEKISKKKVDHWQYWTNPPIEKIKWVEAGIKNGEFYFIKNKDAVTIGMVRVLDEDELYWGKKDDLSKYIHSLVVIETFEGQGIGKLVLQKIENEAKNNGFDYLRLDADSKNPKLCKYYENQGFEKVGVKELPLSIYNLYQKEIR
ncbi:GNAT family N-acetyltransferase [Tamlana sp. s12]|uniref:GNAT family N-acetyltransferase n=1 Tax=Tamlana sp. s12 TaxID=1630406 RepID=UPI0007FEB429|nr:GNAT family N-acetyltransferase [Tamlana sp. s12]OBQ55793.1 GCN5 family acetyltransferase [Tamlana sp. s12]QQY83719.1 GNAT family N-acetyltransferase [Tamlana sp. s12]